MVPSFFGVLPASLLRTAPTHASEDEPAAVVASAAKAVVASATAVTSAVDVESLAGVASRNAGGSYSRHFGKETADAWSAKCTILRKALCLR